MPLGLTYIQETTVFREYGPLAGNTIRAAYEFAPTMGDLLSRQTVDLDARYYMRIGTNGVLALRGRGYKSWGEFPGYMVLRRQFGDARLRLSVFPRQQGVLRQRRIAVPADRGGPHADRGGRRVARRLLRQLRWRRATRGCR